MYLDLFGEADGSDNGDEAAAADEDDMFADEEPQPAKKVYVCFSRKRMHGASLHAYITFEYSTSVFTVNVFMHKRGIYLHECICVLAFISYHLACSLLLSL